MPRGRIITANPVNGRHALNRGRVAWWLPLSHLYGGGRLYDLLGLNHGTLNSMGSAANGWRPTTRPGGWGHLLTDGTAGYVSAPVPAGIGGATTATIAGWVYRSATGTKQAFGFDAVSSSNRFGVAWLADNNVYVTIGNGYAYAASTATGWHRIVHVYDSAASPTSALYLDGVALTLSITGGGAFGSGALPSAANLGGYWVGREVANGYCAGSYDDLPVASRAWSAAEAWADFDLGRRGYPGVLNRRSPALLLLMPAAGGVTVAVTDSGTGAEAIGSTAKLPLSDPGGGLEYAGMAATLTRTDSGAGADSLVTTILVRMTDAGVASDAMRLGPVSILLPDAGAGAEASGLAASFRIADPGAGADALSPTVLATMADAGSGRDAYAVAAVSILLTDSGTGDEASNLAGSFKIADSGAGADVLATGLTLTIFDSGTGADYLAAAVATAAVVVAMADSGSGHESPIITVVTPTIPGGGYDPTFILLGGIPGFVVAVPALIRDGDVYDAIYALLWASGQFSVVTTSKTAPQAAPPSDAGASCHLVQQGAASRQEPHYARELRIPRYDLEIYVRTAFEEDPYQVADRIEAAVRDILLSKANRTLGGIVLTEYSALARTAIDFSGSPDVYVRLMGQAGYVADYDLGGFRDIT